MIDDEVRGFLLEILPEKSAALTLNMKQGDRHGWLDEIEARKNFRHFMNRLNQRAYGNAFRRYGKRLQVLPVLERSRDNRLHYHAFLGNPFDDISQLRTEVWEAWSKTRWGYGQFDVQSVYSDGWLDYIMKSGRLDALDVENMYTVR
ncbi:hypothetical protein [Aliiroseovarius sp. PrR006]|uniref:rolling circle replication-associated protein n=1 Tax=Aliiroseovarius sp. PrR006 TaxID=2706883 RepID=UPI0013D22D1E|nr:hypothetical protein [Aliiroseovarius sp. PrR006]NDW52130.1 hypothetical protein [Aliiroseovarius sp. PrR006]